MNQKSRNGIREKYYSIGMPHFDGFGTGDKLISNFFLHLSDYKKRKKKNVLRKCQKLIR